RRGLMRQLALGIADEQMAAWLVRPLRLQAMGQIDEAFDRRLESHADADAGSFNDAAIATRARVRCGGPFRPGGAALKGPRHICRDLRARTIARVHQTRTSEPIERL